MKALYLSLTIQTGEFKASFPLTWALLWLWASYRCPTLGKAERWLKTQLTQLLELNHQLIVQATMLLIVTRALKWGIRS